MSDIVQELRRAFGIEGKPARLLPQVNVKELVRAQRKERFDSLCPLEFLQTIDRRLLGNPKAWDLADSWDGKFPGLWLWSHATGRGKTRMLWRKFGVLHVQNGLSVQRTTGLNLAEEYHDAYQRNATAAFHRSMAACRAVMLDDLDKMALPAEGQGFAERDQAARNSRMLRELFDTFYEERTIVLVTANEPISWFAERIGGSAERRMRAVCEEISFQ